MTQLIYQIAISDELPTIQRHGRYTGIIVINLFYDPFFLKGKSKISDLTFN
jgi:hypothetical protein